MRSARIKKQCDGRWRSHTTTASFDSRQTLDKVVSVLASADNGIAVFTLGTVGWDAL
jgi:hypothetical protein